MQVLSNVSIISVGFVQTVSLFLVASQLNGIVEFHLVKKRMLRNWPNIIFYDQKWLYLSLFQKPLKIPKINEYYFLNVYNLYSILIFNFILISVQLMSVQFLISVKRKGIKLLIHYVKTLRKIYVMSSKIRLKHS